MHEPWQPAGAGPVIVPSGALPSFVPVSSRPEVSSRVILISSRSSATAEQVRAQPIDAGTERSGRVNRLRYDTNARPFIDKCSGFTLFELTIGMVFLMIAFLGFTSLLIMNTQSQETSAREALVTNALRNMAETMRSTPFSDIATTYQGFSFSISGTNATGTVQVFVDETDNSPAATELGLPRDLDGDGAATNANVTGSYMLLPVTIEVAWTDRAGSQTRDHYLFLSNDE